MNMTMTIEVPVDFRLWDAVAAGEWLRQKTSRRCRRVVCRGWRG